MDCWCVDSIFESWSSLDFNSDKTLSFPPKKAPGVVVIYLSSQVEEVDERYWSDPEGAGCIVNHRGRDQK